ncbi:MAG: TonB-dependent receptor plug domain-containing protein, partial [Saprospiraceae bacterium]|nr:TonB-dependent receptor plug domain-containing protein [Bacteroidia bacterium]NNL91545.1 TonB-dependent receptor plug domain-containing protein [Saprospiraceae bacterium]
CRLINTSTNSKSIVLDPGEMNVLPGLVDNDIFATTLLLPGINSPKESLDDIFIRGGTPDQNLVLWDGIPMYHTSHLFGTISAFNPFIIDQVDVYRSSIGSEFGGRVSGVIDIKSKSKIPDKVNIGLGVNMTHFHMDIETPLWKNSALFFSYRRSITDIWASPTFLNYAERVFQGSKVEPERFSESNLAYNDFFAFNDANLKWVYNHNKSKFKISMFGALNELDYSTALPNVNAFLLDKLDLNNGGAMFSWERKWSDELDSKLVITNSEFNYDYELFLQLEDETIEPPNRVWSNNKITDGGLKLTFDWKPEQYQRFRFGWQLTDNIINVNLGRTEPDTTEMQMQNFENQIQTLFGEYALELPDIVNMDIGLRFQNSPILEKRFFEPRISIVTKLNEDMRLKASTSKQFQFVSQLVAFDINDLGFSNQIWVAADDQTIPVIESNQWVGGIMYEKDDWTLDVEGYVKELVGITSLSVLSDLLSQYAQGKSKVRGVDILLKRRYKNFRSWLSFTLSETLYEFPSIPPGSFPAPHDQKYIIQWVNLYKQDQWEFSLGVNLRSGLPYRNASGLELEQNSQGNFYYAIQYEELNAARLDPYFRVDGSVIYNFGQQEGIDGYIGFSIQNMTNHRNVLGREFFRGRQDGSGKPTLLSNDELGLKWTPNFTVNVSF